MNLSPSEYWNVVERLGFVTVDDCISIRMQHGQRHVMLQVTINHVKHTKQAVAHNPLALLSVVDSFKKLRDKMRADSVKAILEEEQARATAEFLARQRAEIARKHRERIEEEQRRMEEAASKMYQPIRAILERVTPVIDPWSYRNVYGKPAEVFIF